MELERLVAILCSQKELFFYLFRSEQARVQECYELIEPHKLDQLQELGLLDIDEEYVLLDARIVSFFESFLKSDHIEIAAIIERLEEIEHKLSIAIEHRKKEELFFVKRELMRLASTIQNNLLLFRFHIDSAYKGAGSFELKRQELARYKERLDRFEKMLQSLERFLATIEPKVRLFFDRHLELLLRRLHDRLLGAKKTLGTLTQDLISYINKVERRAAFVEHIFWLKELKSKGRLRSQSRLHERIEDFEVGERITLISRLDEDIVESETFEQILKKRSKKIKKEYSFAKSDPNRRKKIELVDLFSLHRHFCATNMDLATFLSQRISDQERILEIYAQMVLLFEHEYEFSYKSIIIGNKRLRQVYAKA